MSDYDHSDKIGNEGDLVKHAVLHNIVKQIVKKDNVKLFHYAESHTGRAVHPLLDNGKGEDGIGKFISKAKGKIKGKNFSSLAEYYDICKQAVSEGIREYPGSSGLVFRILQEHKVPCKFSLWDTDCKVSRSLRAYFKRRNVNAIVSYRDGYNGVSNLKKVTLVLIDPPALPKTGDEKDVFFNTLSSLKRQMIPFMCWTPVTSNNESREAEKTSKAFYNDERFCYDSERVLWDETFRARTPGCQITVSPEFNKIAKETGKDLRKLMDWNMI